MRPGLPLLYLSTAGGLALTTRALLGHPPPLPLAGACLAGYLALLGLGVTWPRLQMWSPLTLRVPHASTVALTLDDPPTADLLRTLARHDAHATFFVDPATSPELLREALAAGHEIGLRTTDPWLPLRPASRQLDELSRALAALTAASGQPPTLLRPARGWTTPRLARLADELALDLVVGQPWYPSGDSLQPGDVLRVSARSLGACLRAIAARNVKATTVSALLSG